MDNFGDFRNLRFGHFGFDCGGGIGKLLHSSLSGIEERAGSLEGEDLCPFLGLLLIGWADHNLYGLLSPLYGDYDTYESAVSASQTQ